MDLLILDVETSGVDPTKDHIVEVATAIYSVEHASVVKQRSWLVRAETNEAEAVNGIPAALLRDHPHACVPVLTHSWVFNWARECACIVAHNAEFDAKWFEPNIGTWVCSMNDLEWPRKTTSKSLAALALAHGVGIASAHRAMADVDVLCRLLQRVAETGHDVGAMIRRGLRPKARFVVADRAFDPARNELAKAHGFRWEQETKSWVRTMAIEDAGALPFRVEQLPDA